MLLHSQPVSGHKNSKYRAKFSMFNFSDKPTVYTLYICRPLLYIRIKHANRPVEGDTQLDLQRSATSIC